MIEVASLRYGVIFKKAFSQPYIFTAFVKDLIGIDIEIEKVETEKSFSPIIGKVDSRFDLFAEDKKNRVIIDIQHKRYSDHYDRFLHYHCTALLEQITSSANYKPNMQVFTIVVLTSGDKHKTDISITDFEPKKLDGTGIGETQHKIIYVSPKYASDETPEPYREWLKAIDDSLDEQVEESDYNNEIIKDIFALIKKDKITPKEYAKMKNQYSEEEYLKDQKQEAKDTKALEIAKKMLNAGMDIETITAMTGLMPDLIKEKFISFSTAAQDHQKG
jgi:2,3-bisphosphoglycerate-independent phosphoglycerate mutase